MSRAPNGERRKLDAYYTSDDLARALVDLLPIDPFLSVIEPSCGGGAFVRALQRFDCRVYGIDLDPDASGLLMADNAVVGDFLNEDPAIPDCGWIIGNPPYSDAEAHCRHAIDITGRHVAFLLRLGFLESKKRAAFWAEHPPRKVWVLTERPSFTGGGTDSAAYGWFWWDAEHDGPTELGWLSWK